MTLLSFSKITDQQNILFDEYFGPYCNITIIALNYDGNGTALCNCDGALLKVELPVINKLLFGVPVTTLQNYLQSIFDPNFGSNELQYENGRIVFSLAELNKLKKYDIDNLAKKTLKELRTFEGEVFRYYEETTGALEAQGACVATTQVYGNTKSLVFHRADCKSFSAITCASLFTSPSEAESAGYKPCKICHPE